MKEGPILFSAPMVRALLAGSKTQTRRVVKPQPPGPDGELVTLGDGEWAWHDGDLSGLWRCPYGQPGDRLWVRETFRGCRAYEVQGYPPRDWGNKPIWFEADGTAPGSLEFWAKKARPSIHMPRWASRILLEVTDVRVERLQRISEADAQAEGAAKSIPFETNGYFAEGFCELWESINGAGSWRANPWVWVVSFRRLDA